MTPIISPWIIYFLGMCTGVKLILLLVGFLGGGIYIACKYLDVNERPRRSIVTLFVLISLLGILIPDEGLATKMLIAQNVTYERMEVLGETVQDIYEDIISLVDNKED